MISAVRKWFAPLFLQALVDGPHVIDSMTIIVAQISLTYFVKSVDSHSFFDISNVFPVGGKSGGQAKITVTRRKLEVKEGRRGSRQLTAGRGEQEMFRGNIEAPRR
jgi:hypothetical protein